MSTNPNYVSMVGNLTADPELRFTTSGQPVVNFRMACTTRRPPAQGSNEWRDDTEFVNVVAWRSLAENISASVQKGDRIMVTAELKTRSYDDKDGVTQYRTELIATEVGVALRWQIVAEIEKSTSTKELVPAKGDRSEPVYGDDEPF